MALPHAEPATAIDVRRLGDDLTNHKTATLIKTDRLEVIRLIVPKGKEIKPHQVAGEITVQCLEGIVIFNAGDDEVELSAGLMLYLPGGQQHSLRAIEDSSLLLTIQLGR